MHKFLFSPLWREGEALHFVFNYPATRSETLAAFYYALPSLLQKGVNWSVIAIEASYALALIIPKFRKTIWSSNFCLHLGILLTLKFASLSVIMLIIHLFMVEENWWPMGGISKLRSGFKRKD